MPECHGVYAMVEVNVKVLTEQLDAAQAILDEIRITCGCSAFGSPRGTSSTRPQAVLETAKKAYLDRKSRSAFIGSHEIFGEPAWDMLLDLFIKQTEKEEVTLKAANLSNDRPISTELRWLKLLEQHGLIACQADPHDNARHVIHLTPTGYEGMLRYLESIAP